MRVHRSQSMRVVAESRRQPLVPSGVMAMVIFVIIEAMLFAGMISAFTIIRSGAIVWPPPNQPRLPVEATAFNTALLMASGLLLFLAHRAFQRDRTAARVPLLLSMLLGMLRRSLQKDLRRGLNHVRKLDYQHPLELSRVS